MRYFKQLWFNASIKKSVAFLYAYVTTQEVVFFADFLTFFYILPTLPGTNLAAGAYFKVTIYVQLAMSDSPWNFYLLIDVKDIFVFSVQGVWILINFICLPATENCNCNFYRENKFEKKVFKLNYLFLIL